MCKPICLVAWCMFSPVLCKLVAQISPPSSGFSKSEQYRAIKATIEQFHDRGLLFSNIDKPGLPASRHIRGHDYNLATCADSGEYLGLFEDQPARDEQLARLVTTAVDTVVWEHDLKNIGVPEEIWRAALEKYESAEFGDGKEESVSELAAELNGRVARAGRSQPKFVIVGWCGAGEVKVHFVLKPPDGQLFLIPVFLYKLCQAQHLNPTDLKSCDRWREVFSGTVSNVSGNYMYLAHWVDGVVRCGAVGDSEFRPPGTSSIEITKLQSPICSPGW